jgi:IclR family acetate operon transcriptional repressor
MEVSDSASIGVIARAARILRTLGESSSGMSLGQIARQSGLARSTVQRLVAALDAEQLVVSSGAAGRIVLGPAVLRLGTSMRADTPARLRAQIRTLSAELGETVDLSVVRNDRVVFVDQVQGAARLLAVSHVGASFPLYCCASGKAYLAGLADRDVEELIGRAYQQRTPSTRSTLEALLQDLHRIRESGLAIDEEEHTEGISAIGIGIGDDGGGWFGVSVQVPSQRFAAKREQIIEAIRAFSDRF